MAIVKVNWSGGKDSTASAILHIRKGDKIKAVCYIPMLTPEIPLITKKHYDFIMNAKFTLTMAGAEVYIVHGMTYKDYVLRVSTRGKYKGKIFGFPSYITGQCGFRLYGKVKALNNCDVGYFDYEDIGIAFDEPKRQSQLNNKKRSILCEMGITENDAKSICKSTGLLSPLYENCSRDGCSVCPQGNEERLKEWLNDYPEALPILKELQEIVKEKRPERHPLREGWWNI